MILYVNGDSHSAAAQATNDYSFANDDFAKVALGTKPHPANLAISYGMHLSKFLKLALICDAESGTSNERILRTSKEFIDKQDDTRNLFIVIGWTHCSKTEFIDTETGETLQADMLYPNSVPKKFEKEFRRQIVKRDLKNRTIDWHNKIYDFHRELVDNDIKHLFFNSVSTFESIAKDDQKDWKGHFMHPYKHNFCYVDMLDKAGFGSNELNNFNADAHFFWAKYLYNWLTDQNLFV